MHPGVRVTSTSRTGSQNETGIPTLGIGSVHLHKILFGLLVSSPSDDTRKPPMVMGNKQDQHTSDIGFTKRPTHLAWTGIESMINIEAINIKPFSDLNLFKMLDTLLLSLSALFLLSLLLRQTSLITEPRRLIKSPFGKLLFFDGVALYAAFIILCLFLIQLFQLNF
jgi:hypothetical protein